MYELNARIAHWVWERDGSRLSWLESLAVRAARMAHMLSRDMADGQLTLRAMGLVYATLLALVPLLALGFSLLKAFGIHNAIEPVLLQIMQPLGDDARELVETIIGFVENVKVGVLGVVGLGVLLYAVIMLIQKIESGLNFIWKVDRPRSWARRFSDYLSVLIAGPLVLASAIGLTARLTNYEFVQQLLAMEPFGATFYLLGRLLPYLLVSAGFTGLYVFLPNTRVRLRPALIGGLFAGVLWQSASWAFATFAASTNNYNAIYSGFAIGFLLLIWLYIGWLIVLLGCRVAFLVQHPENIKRRIESAHIGARTEEYLALRIMALVGENFLNDKPPWTLEALSTQTRVAPEHVYRIADMLIRAGMLAETEPNEALLPCHDLDAITVQELLAVVRAGENLDLQVRPEGTEAAAVDKVMQMLDEARDRALEKMTLRDLVSAASPEADRPQPEAVHF